MTTVGPVRLEELLEGPLCFSPSTTVSPVSGEGFSSPSIRGKKVACSAEIESRFLAASLALVK